MSFWEKGYQAVFISSLFKNPHMHSAKDTLDKINAQYLTRAARAMIGLMRDLAKEGGAS